VEEGQKSLLGGKLQLNFLAPIVIFFVCQWHCIDALSCQQESFFV